MFELYPKEMEKYRIEYMFLPPEPIEIEETEMEKQIRFANDGYN